MNGTDSDGIDDAAAFRAFVDAQWGSLLRTAYLLVGDHGYAEDLAQATLIRLHRNWHRIERKDAPQVYARKILANLASSHWRRLLRKREDPVAQPPDRTVGDFTTEVDLRQELWSTLQQVPPRMRTVLVLRYYEGFTETQVASALGCSVGTVKSQASRGLDRLRALYPSASFLSPQGEVS